MPLKVEVHAYTGAKWLDFILNYLPFSVVFVSSESVCRLHVSADLPVYSCPLKGEVRKSHFCTSLFMGQLRYTVFKLAPKGRSTKNDIFVLY